MSYYDVAEDIGGICQDLAAEVESLKQENNKLKEALANIAKYCKERSFVIGNLELSEEIEQLLEGG